MGIDKEAEGIKKLLFKGDLVSISIIIVIAFIYLFPSLTSLFQKGPTNITIMADNGAVALGGNNTGTIETNTIIQKNEFPKPKLTYTIASSSREIMFNTYETNFAVSISFVANTIDQDSLGNIMVSNFIRNTKFDPYVLFNCEKVNKDSIKLYAPLGSGKIVLNFNIICFSHKIIDSNEKSLIEYP
ncbi:MAG: hypothetical protein WCT02_03190 [Candidatus Paceibacterota bacterium]